MACRLLARKRPKSGADVKKTMRDALFFLKKPSLPHMTTPYTSPINMIGVMSPAWEPMNSRKESRETVRPSFTWTCPMVWRTVTSPWVRFQYMTGLDTSRLRSDAMYGSFLPSHTLSREKAR